MTFKRILSLLLALTMLMGMVSNGVFVTKTAAAEEQTIHVAGDLEYGVYQYYLFADVVTDGVETKQFYSSGSTNTTTPGRSLIARQTSYSNGTKVMLEQNGDGILIKYSSAAAIYHYDSSSPADGVLDTGEGTAKTNSNFTFTWDKTSQRIYHMIGDEQYVLAAVNLYTTYKNYMWRMQFVPVADLEKEGVFPAKLGVLRACAYGTEWKTDGTNHWHECACGAKSALAAHDYKLTNHGDTHIYKCECGLTKDEGTHEYGSDWVENDDGHWHECACGAKKDESGHNFGAWVNDYTAGTRSQTCGDCGFVNTEELNHACTPADTWSVDATHHWKNCAECGKPIESSKTAHTFGEQWSKNADKHWRECSCGAKADEGDHSYSAWVCDFEAKTQSRSCSGCGDAQTEVIPFFDTLDSLDEAKAAAANGTTFYLTAVTKEGVRYFLRHAVSGEGASTTKTATTGSALFTTDDIDHASIYPVSLYAGVTENTFAIRYPRAAGSSGAPYCLYIRDEGGEGNVDTYITATGSDATWQARAEFKWDDVNKLFYQEETVNGETVNYVLALTQLEGTYSGVKEVRWHIAAVPMAEALAGTTAAGKDVYPVRLATHSHVYPDTLTAGETEHWQECPCGHKENKAAHTFDTSKSNATHHWVECVCGAKSDEAEHIYSDRKSSETHHWMECACGAKFDETAHEYTIGEYNDTHHWNECSCGAKQNETTHSFADQWSKDATNHWHACACGAKSDDAGHNYGEWVNDYQNNTKTQTCTDCSYENTVELNHTCTGSDEWSTDGENHWKVCGDCGQIIESTKEGHKFADAYQQNGDGHWRVCSVCQAASAVEPHNYGQTYQHNDAQHWQECACGRKTDAEDHMYGDWIVDSKPSDSAAGSKHKECAGCKKQVTEPIPMLLKEAIYYLTAKVGGKDYYFLHTAAGTGIFGAHTLPVTDDVAKCTSISIIRTEIDGEYTYAVQYVDADNTVWYLYVNDEGKDGKVDTGRTKSLRNDRTTFLWDAENQRLYQQEVIDSEIVNYVLAIKKLSNDTTEELRLVAVPENELSDSVISVNLELAHVHEFGEKWKSDASGHWHVCACGEKKDQAVHDVTKWNVLEEPGKDEAGIKSGKCDTCGYTVVTYIPATGIEAPKDGAVVYLSAEIGGVRYYYRHSLSGESVGTTVPNSLYTTSVVTGATGITVKVSEGVYLLTYDMNDRNFRIYVASNGTAVTAKDDADLINFSWDDEAKVLYQMEDGVKYVLAFKMMTNSTTKADEVRMLAVPETELSDSVVAAQLIDGHIHSYGKEWKSDASGHWNECDCGTKSEVESHSVTKWNVTKEPTATESGTKTGKCDVCGYETSVTIPSTGAIANAPKEDALYTISGEFDSVTYFYLHKNGGTGETGFHSLHVTDAKDSATGVSIAHEAKDGTYIFHVMYQDETGTVWYLFVNDEGADGRMDTGRTKSLRDDRTTFLWDAENQRLYQDENGVKYALALKKLEKTAGGEELRLVAVPESELGSDTVAVTLELSHTHSYGKDWKSDATGHWHVCECGAKKDFSAHEITKWTVDKEATDTESGSKSGKCDVCGYTVVTYIPSTGIHAPEDGAVVYLSAEIGGVRYYYRHSLSGESVGTTVPNSLYTTSVVTGATGITVKVSEGVYLLTYDMNDRNYRIYVASNGTAVTAKDDADLINFSWDDEAKVLYQTEDGVKYVLAFKVMTNSTTKADEVRMLAVPETELSDSVVAAQLIDGHIHSYGKDWQSDATGHWHVCDCGAKSEVESHSVTKWNVTKEPTSTEPGTKTGKCDTCGYQVSAAVPATGALENAPDVNTVYYLTGKYDSAVYYLLHKNGGTSETGFQSLHVTDTKDSATGVSVVYEEKDGAYIFHVKYQDETGAVWYLYVNDEGADGKMDTGRTKSLRDDRTTFLWDVKNKRLYQDENGVKYVLALKKLEKTAGGEEVRLLAVPESELGEGVAAVTLVAGHTHSYGKDWKSDSTGHWHVCECGSKKDLSAHEITNWTVDKEPTETESGSKSGKCDVCGYKVTRTIPATGITVVAPEDGDVRYLTGEVGGVRYYFRHSLTGESVTSTNPYSLYATTDISKANAVTMAVDGDVYRITYDLGEKNYRIYVNASGVGITAKDDAALIDFSWDAGNGCFYQMEGDVKYVLVFKVMVNNGTNNQEVRLTAVAESELNDDMAVATLEEAKEHSFGQEWKSDDNSHWHECECGARTDEDKHTVSKWTVEKEATDTEPGVKSGVCDICGHKVSKQVPAGLKPGTYYLTGVFGGKPYYFRHTAEGEKVTHTAPYSLVTDAKQANATLVSIDWDEDTNTYTISYFTNRTLYIYVNDEKPEGDVDTGVTSSVNASRTPFLWDTEAKRLYQLEGGVKYILAFKMLTNAETGEEELRLVAVPETELGDGVVAAQLQVDHIHSYGDSWQSDATSHYHVCDCGAKADENDHIVNEWTVEKEATATESGVKTGQCAVCGYKVKVAIPATAPVEPPKAGQTSYLSVVIDGVRYYFRHTVSGESVTNTEPYSLYVTTNVADAIPVTVQSVGDAFRLTYTMGEKTYFIYINGSGVGITAKEDAALIDFYWDEENSVLYQLEGDVKQVLAFRTMSNSSTGQKELRITSVALAQIQAGSDAYAAQLHSGNGTPDTGDDAMLTLMSLAMAMSVCAMAAVVTGKKKWF